MLNAALRFIILHLVRLFYPRIEVAGREHLPAGPLVFVLNHPNGLLDPLVLMVGVGRQISFLAKSTFYANPVGRFCMEAFGALPVYRQRDEGHEGGPKGDAAMRNEATFARCRALLQQGRAMALFPEGTTHSETMLLPLRTGAARIALSAEAEASWDLDLHIVPVGLWYQSKTLFRTAVLVEIGQPFTIADLAAAYAADERQAVQELTIRIDSALDAVVFQAQNAELFNGIPLVAAWTAPDGPPATLEEQRDRAVTLLAAYQHLHAADPSRLEQIAQQARNYAQVLHTLGIADPWSLELAAANRRRIAGLLAFLVLGCLPALAGFVLSYPPYRLARPISLRIVGKFDEITSTVKLISGSILVLLGWIIEALICGFFFGPLWGGLLLVVAPALAYIALRWGEVWRELRDVVEANWLLIGYQRLAQELIARRQALAAQVLEAVRTALPEVTRDFQRLEPR